VRYLLQEGLDVAKTRQLDLTIKKLDNMFILADLEGLVPGKNELTSLD
jgi:hypothetical protein